MLDQEEILIHLVKEGEGIQGVQQEYLVLSEVLLEVFMELEDQQEIVQLLVGEQVEEQVEEQVVLGQEEIQDVQ